MNLKNFELLFKEAKACSQEDAVKLAIENQRKHDYVKSAIYAIVAGNKAVPLSFEFAILLLNQQEQTENIQMLLTQACRHDYAVGEKYISFVQTMNDDSFAGNMYTVVFNAIYNSGLTLKDPNYIFKQIKWFVENGKTGYAEKLRKRFAANMGKRLKELQVKIKEADKNLRQKK